MKIHTYSKLENHPVAKAAQAIIAGDQKRKMKIRMCLAKLCDDNLSASQRKKYAKECRDLLKK